MIRPGVDLRGAGLFDLLRRGGVRRQLATYGIVHFLFFLVVPPTPGQLGRYFAPIWALLPIVATAEWLALREWRPLGRIAGLLPVLAGAMVVGYIPQVVHWSKWHAGAVHHMDAVHGAASEWILENVPGDEPIAAFDIGLFGWTIPHRIIDLGGITSRRTLDHIRYGRVPELLEREGARILVLPEFLGWNRWYVVDLLGVDPALLEPIHRFELGRDDVEHLWPTMVACPALGIYEWPGAP